MEDLQVDSDEDDGSDSGIDDRPQKGYGGAETVYHRPRGDDDTVNSTRSLYDSDVVYIMIHGRRYCKEYYMPNDEEEQTRTQILHGVYLYLFDQRLTLAPIDNPQKILDVGTGSGEWAMAMGDEYPEAEVIGTDIAKIQPNAVPLNVFFEIDDAEEEGGWTWPEDEFDLIHFRTMAGAFKDWNYIYSETYRHLKPGGWIEVLDFDDHKKLLSYFSEDSGVQEWFLDIIKALRIMGRPRGTWHLDPKTLENAGFVDVRSDTKTIPMGIWPEDPEAQSVGKHFLVAQLCGIEALCLRPLTEVLGWDPAEVRRMCDIVTDRVREVALDPEKAKGMGFNVKVLIGRKPGGPDLDDPDPEITSKMNGIA
ncbi:putative Demethylmenaquinone methyltransferase [Tricladium varicosporioides]|nr:putative Demethylmenaquinone methyltransferase [Hymenoscyphus varicosporioides]